LIFSTVLMPPNPSIPNSRVPSVPMSRVSIGTPRYFCASGLATGRMRKAYNSGVTRTSSPSPLDIQAALAAAGRDIGPDQARLLAEEIGARGDLDRAVAALAADESSSLLSLLLAYRAALAEAVEPVLRARRFRRMAQDLDARAEPLWREAAQDAGRAAARRLRGEAALADTFARRAAAAETLACELEAQAFALRLQAVRVEAELARRQDLVEALTGLAA
jgi:hypothetical protein